MKRVFILSFLFLFACGSLLAQNCSTGKYDLTSGSSSQNDACRQNNTTVTLSVSYNYDVSCVYTAGNKLAGQTYFPRKNSSSFYTSQCQNLFYCYGHGGMRYTAATDPNDFNRFFNEGFDSVVTRPRDQLVCIPGGSRTDFNQCAGQGCDAGPPPSPPPSPSPQPSPKACFLEDTSCNGSGGGGGVGTTDPCLGGQGPDGGTGTGLTGGRSPDPTCSPIIIDTEGEGFHLTSAAGGVMFDIAGDGRPAQTAWTATGFRNALLALPGADGLVHNGKELFGNFTPQPVSNNPNGFLALAEFDRPENGGNGDGVIDEHDAVYSRLRLWIDENHDGISQPEELHKLAELGVSMPWRLIIIIPGERTSSGTSSASRPKLIQGSGGTSVMKHPKLAAGRMTSFS